MINRNINLHPVGAALFQALAIGVLLLACSGPDDGNDMLKPSTLPDLSGLSAVSFTLYMLTTP